MDYRCLICDDLYPHVYPDSLEICATCYDKNFAGAQPPLDLPVPMAREALEASVDTAHHLTPRQVQAMRRMAERWRQEEDTP